MDVENKNYSKMHPLILNGILRQRTLGLLLLHGLISSLHKSKQFADAAIRQDTTTLVRVAKALVAKGVQVKIDATMFHPAIRKILIQKIQQSRLLSPNNGAKHAKARKKRITARRIR